MIKSNYYLERLGQAVLTVLAVISLTFVLIRMMPGGPAQFLRAQLLQNQEQVSTQRVNRLVQNYINIQPDKPLIEQYFSYMASILTGDFGQSLWYKEPVSGILAEAIPWTLFIMSVGLLLTFSIGIVLGAVLAYSEGTRFDVTTSSVATFLNSVPYYVAGVLLLYILGYQLNWFPTGGKINPDLEAALTVKYLWSATYHAILPISSLVITGFGIQALTMRGNSIRVLGEDYVRVAQLRGLTPKRISLYYIGRNAVLPMYTGMMISIGFMFGGSVILEQIYQYPGVGYFLFKAVKARDYPLMMGGFIIITVAVAISIFVADLTYGKIDPRASRGDDREAY